MMVHPPLLYSGYTLSAVPFAFGIAALATRRVGAEWLFVVRRFALGGWFLLGIGILLGARWSYSELGWGGYWAWDAVENASLLPWLTATAFIHSSMIQEKRGMLKVWNVSLLLGTGILAVLGTFLVRSGVIDSIHAFGASTLGVPFLLLLGAMVIASVGLVVSRRDLLRSERKLDSVLSREAIFLAQNVVLVGLAFAVFWGTFFPLISEALSGTRHSLGPPWFDEYTVPLALVLVLLTGIGPLIAWRRATPSNLRRSFAIPVGIGVLALLVLATFGATAHLGAWLMFGLAAFVAGCVGQEFWRGTRARRAMTGEAIPLALVSLVRRNRRRYGGYLVHLGMAILFVGIAGSSSFKHVQDAALKPGQSVKTGDYTMTFVKPTATGTAEKISLGAVVRVTKNGKKVTTLTTTRGYYPSRDPSLGQLGRFFDGEATSEVGLQAGLRRDVWTAINPNLAPLQGAIDKGDKLFATALDRARASGNSQQIRALFAARDEAIVGLARRWVNHPWAADFRFIVSPLVTWIWLGGVVVIAGGLLALWPAPATARGRVRARYAARVGRELAERSA
jgi:cytochrome c-type biogenesis protein CcmF